MYKVLVTGANELLGTNLVHMLFRNGYDVGILVRQHANMDYLKGFQIHQYYGDISDESFVDKVVKGHDYVIHAAGITGQSGISYSEYECVNVTATKLIAAACLKHGVKRLIHVSTANTIAPGTKENPGTELNGFSLFKAQSHYINTKYLAQQWVLEQVRRNKLNAVIINPTFMLGPFDSKPSSGRIILYGLKKRLLFCPPGGKNFVHVRDVCTGIIKAMHAGDAGECYLLAGENLSYKEFFRKLHHLSGYNPTVIRMPAFILKVAGALMSMAGRLTGQFYEFNKTAAYLLCVENYYTGQKSATRLGIQFTAISQAILESYQCLQMEKNKDHSLKVISSDVDITHNLAHPKAG